MPAPLQIPPVPGGGELLVTLVVGLARVVLFLLVAYWVFTDAGRRDDEPALWAVVVGGLGIVSLLAGLFALVVYVGHRA